MKRIDKFLRSVLPADPTQLIFLAGVFCLFVAPRLRLWPPGLGVAPERLADSLVQQVQFLGVFFLLPISFPGVAGYSKPVFVSISQGAVKHLAEAAKTSRTTREVIKSRLRVRGKQTALSHARMICLRSEKPLAADEITRRILADGYSSRSKTFTDYVRRLLRQDGRFVANAEGQWMLRAVA